MKTELIRLAKEKEFKSELLSSEPMKYNHKEDIRYYLWMCEIQKWLRDNHNMDTNISHEIHMKWFYATRIIAKEYDDYDNPIFDMSEGFETYELALEKSLLEALKLIKDE